MNEDDFTPNESDETPPGYRRLRFNADEIDYLVRYWEVADHSELFAWGVRLLHDLTRCDEKGWRLALVKADLDDDTGAMTLDKGYGFACFKMQWLSPTADSFVRISPETLEAKMKKDDIAPEDEVKP